MSKAKFGPGGNGDLFYAQGGKGTVQAPAWVKNFGLDAYEFEAGNGLSASEETLRKIGEEARAHGISMSLHTPYFISLAGIDPQKRLKSVEYIQKSLWAAELIGAKTIVIHCGGAAKISREKALSLSCDTLEKVIEAVGHTEIKLGIETMGKVNQLGTLDEVIEQCKVDKHYVPVVDFGHMNSREQGLFYTVDDYRRIFDRIAEGCSPEVAKNLHCHFSKIEYTSAGEKRHLTFADEVYGPDFEPLMEAIAKDGLTPTIICESDGTQAEDALAMKKSYEAFLNQN
jgi:deoxyribonuclease-4